MTILWLLRTALFIISGAIPIIHPAAAVSYDSASAFLWFAVIPLEMAAAYFLKPSWTGKPVYTAAFLAPLAIAAVFFTRFDSYTDYCCLRYRSVHIHASAIPLQSLYSRFCRSLFLAVRAYRLLMFARSSEDAAYSSSLLQTTFPCYHRALRRPSIHNLPNIVPKAGQQGLSARTSCLHVLPCRPHHCSRPPPAAGLC